MNYKTEAGLLGIDEIIEFLSKEGKEELVRYGKLRPMVIFVLQEGYRIFSQHLPGSDLMFQEGIDKKKSLEEFLPMLMNLARKTMGEHLTLYAVIIITETWYVMNQHPPGTDMKNVIRDYADGKTPPREDPKRKEAYTITVSFKEGTKTKMILFDRVNGKIVFGEETSLSPSSGGDLHNIFPESEK